VQFERGDRGGELGPDVGRHQVGQLARLGREITLREDGPADEGVSPLPDAAQPLGELEGAFGNEEVIAQTATAAA
jgi:hypothetical protein